MKQIEPPLQTPEQLVQFIEAQRLAIRARRENATGRRAGFLMVGILLIIAFAGISLAVLMGMLPDRPGKSTQWGASPQIEQR